MTGASCGIEHQITKRSAEHGIDLLFCAVTSRLRVAATALTAWGTMAPAEALSDAVESSGMTIVTLVPGPMDIQFIDPAAVPDNAIGAADDRAKVTVGGSAALMAGKAHVVAGSIPNLAHAAVTAALTRTATPAVQAKPTERTSHLDLDAGATFIVLPIMASL